MVISFRKIEVLPLVIHLKKLHAQYSEERRIEAILKK
jgi:hypothetical protein